MNSHKELLSHGDSNSLVWKSPPHQQTKSHKSGNLHQVLVILGLILLTLAGCRVDDVTPTSPSKLPVHTLYGVEENKIPPADRLNLIRGLSTELIRRNGLIWSKVEPEEGVRYWNEVTALELDLRQMSEAGLQIILVVRSTPAWAQQVPGSACGPVHPEKLPAFARFVHDAVERYSQPPFNVRYWEIWNEPDIPPALVEPNSVFGCWGAKEDLYYGGGYYAEMLKLVYPEVKSVDPLSQVLIGGLLLDCDPLNPPQDPNNPGTRKDCNASKYLQGILENDGGDHFDGVSFHAYDYYEGSGNYANPGWHSRSDTTGPALSAKAAYIRNLLSSYGHTGKYIMNTEGALLCLAKNEEICLSSDFAKTKSRYLVQSKVEAQAAGLAANIWFSLSGWRWSGLVSDSYQHEPAYTAFRVLVDQLAGSDFVKEVEAFPGVRIYEFRRDSAGLWVLWSLDGDVHLVSLPVQPSAAYDINGSALPIMMNFEVGSEPVYVWWMPGGDK